MTSPESFGGIDPCPGVNKYAEIAFKCRPSTTFHWFHTNSSQFLDFVSPKPIYILLIPLLVFSDTFYNKVVCAGDRLRLKCHKSSRIVIYSASFGSTATSVAECPQQTDSHSNSESLMVSEDCQVSYATETVMSSCHARKKCSLDADVGTFGDPGCAKNARLHLKVVYTCVPKDVLKELDIGVTDNEKTGNSDVLTNEDTIDTSDYIGFVEEPRYIPEPDVSSTPQSSGHKEKVLKASKDDASVVSTKKTYQKSDTIVKNNYEVGLNNSVDSEVNCTIIAQPDRVIGFISEWISAVNFIKRETNSSIVFPFIAFISRVSQWFNWRVDWMKRIYRFLSEINAKLIARNRLSVTTCHLK